MPCRHDSYFYWRCLMIYFRQSTLCPYCRQECSQMLSFATLS
jgi:hypothetical protein